MRSYLRLSAVVSSLFITAPLLTVRASPAPQTYTWKNVKIGGGGGFVPNIVFNPTQQGLAYARTDMGGAYRLNPADDTWTPLLDWADNARWDYWGCDALATDPVSPNRLYLLAGMYTNSYDPNNATLLISTDTGSTFTTSPLPFKAGGNMPGRGMGERLAVDPNSNNILFLGARSGHGLWKSTNYGATWTQVTIPNTGTYAPDPTDTTGMNSDPIGVSFVTFDSTSGAKGAATPRIFIGVATVGSSNLFVSDDAGSTWSAIAGTNNTYMAHKGVLSPSEKVLYISTSNGAGPYDGTLGAVYKYNITSSTITDITPVTGSNLYFGFGGLAVDLQKPGTLMVATLNSWYPDGNIYRSNNSGATWSPLWDWGAYPVVNRYITYDDSLAPWLGPDYTVITDGEKQIGWMMEGLSIDPFDSNHWLYGTGATIYGGHDLTKWDTIHNVTLKSLADGVEQTAVQGLISPPTGPPLLSVVGDIEGFVHYNLSQAPAAEYANPTWATAADIDFAGNAPTNIVRIGTGDSSTGKQVALSTDSGATWAQDYGAADNVEGGKVALSANGDIVLWRTSGNGVMVSQYTNNFTAVPTLPSTAAIASDKKNDSIFYGAAGSSFYLSTNGGTTFAATAGTLGASTSPVKVVVNPNITGDVWVSTDTGLFHSTNSGATFTAIPGITEAWGIALGAPATAGGYPAVFAAANIGIVGYFRSDDGGVNWVQINDAAHGFGSAASNPLTADPRIYGRVYIGTNGRGIFYGDINGAAPPPTSTVSTSTVKSTSSTSSSSSTSKSSSTTSKSSSTVSSSSSTKSSSTTSSPSATSTAVSGAYGQCGGTNWTGPTACVSGYTCTYSNPYYSQCIPA
ncbi:carbohydrate-binding module family 1 protein [Jaapia argillacea MUCL 33604]|uniref:Carbohydrate-binding module family 1 protein n=1 Tax=Jaapia argillacea MUCL 33604 TaxID=933084 RepID=A0A067QJW0_9AGAM|nr:carbohydrate-binding module family 1 protein [Jaapia argillacea MUCL 33604]